MAKQITQLPVAASVAASDVFPLDQSGTTKQATLTAIAAGLPTGTGTGGLVRQINPIFGSGLTVGNIRGNADNSAYTIVGGNSNPGVSTSGAWIGFYGGTSAVNPGALVFGRNSALTGIVTGDGWGINTTNVGSPLTVGGDICINTLGSLYFTDANETSPVFKSQGDNNFVFYGTSSTGNERPIWSCSMRSDASPLQVEVPLKIGGAGTAINTIVTAFVTNYAPASIPANGGTQFLDVTVSGANVSNTICIVNHLGNLSNDSIIIKATCNAANTVRITWINPTTSSVSLSNIGYRITAIYI